jgi:hypothetical protein
MLQFNENFVKIEDEGVIHIWPEKDCNFFGESCFAHRTKDCSCSKKEIVIKGKKYIIHLFLHLFWMAKYGYSEGFENDSK